MKTVKSEHNSKHYYEHNRSTQLKDDPKIQSGEGRDYEWDSYLNVVT